MPIYEYLCTSSGERFEIQQKFSDPPIQTCDQLSCTCGTPQPVTKMISAPAILFKGTGWYVTDYSDKLKEPGSKSENNGKPAEGKSESKTDKQPGSNSAESGTSSPTPAASAAQAGSSGTSHSSGSNASSGSSSSSESSSSSGSKPSSGSGSSSSNGSA